MKKTAEVNRDELSYYSEMLRKISHKKYEFFAVSRIFHLLNDLEIEVVTQQVIKTSEGRFLLDLYFPQFKMAIEIDEDYHAKKIEKDQMREAAVVDATGVAFERIEIKGKSIISVCQKIQDIVDLVSSKKEKSLLAGKFEPFSFAGKYDLARSIRKGEIRVDDDMRFKTHVDVIKIFGKNYGAYQRGVFKYDEDFHVWFPKLYPNDDWENNLIDNGRKIEMRAKDTSKLVSLNKEEEHEGAAPKKGRSDYCLAFAHHKDIFGQVYYAFKGLFRVEPVNQKENDYYLVSDVLKLKENGAVDAQFLKSLVSS